jgi:hypothetical protein
MRFLRMIRGLVLMVAVALTQIPANLFAKTTQPGDCGMPCCKPVVVEKLSCCSTSDIPLIAEPSDYCPCEIQSVPANEAQSLAFPASSSSQEVEQISVFAELLNSKVEFGTGSQPGILGSDPGPPKDTFASSSPGRAPPVRNV